MVKQYTQEGIRDLLEKSNQAVEHAIVAIYNRQTENEKSWERTEQLNKVGFTGAHAEFGSSLAKQILTNKYGKPEGQRLSPKQLPLARKMALHYTRQLLDIAKSKEQLPPPVNPAIAVYNPALAPERRLPVPHQWIWSYHDGVYSTEDSTLEANLVMEKCQKCGNPLPRGDAMVNAENEIQSWVKFCSKCGQKHVVFND